MKKKLIITLIFLIIIGLLVAGGYYLYKEHKQQNPLEIEWVRMYYNYMKDNNEDLDSTKMSLKNYQEDEKIQFCEIETVNKPVMLYSYKELGQPYESVYYINDNNKVKQLQGISKKAKTKYLYNIEEKSYDYYIYETNGYEDIYFKISDAIKINNENEDQDNMQLISQSDSYEINIYRFEIGASVSVTTINGDIIEILNIDDKIIKTDIVEDNWVDINIDTYEEKIIKDFSLAIKTMNKKLTDNVIAFVNHKEEETNLKKEQMAKAIEEIEQKKKEEEEKRLAEEEAKRIAEEEEKKKEEEARRIAEEEARRIEEEAEREAAETRSVNVLKARRLFIELWNI